MLKLRCKYEQCRQHLSAGILKSTCYINVRWFPFDVQKCDLKFGSWTHNGWLLDLQMIDVDISTYIPNGEWDLVGKTRKCRIKRSRSLRIFCWAVQCSHANFLKKEKKSQNQKSLDAGMIQIRSDSWCDCCVGALSEFNWCVWAVNSCREYESDRLSTLVCHMPAS